MWTNTGAPRITASGDDFYFHSYYIANTAGVKIAGNGGASYFQGNVGIGTANPGTNLQVGSGGVGGIGAIQARNATASYISAVNDANSAIAFMGSDSSATGIFGTLSNHPVTLRTNNTERMRIDTSGNVGIGTSPSYKLHVESAQSGVAAIYGHNSAGHGVYGTAQSSGSSYYGVYGVAGSYSSGLARADGYSFVGTGTLYNSGTVYGTAFLYLSDARIKSNVHDLDQGLVTLMKLHPVSFTWNQKAPDGRAGKDDIGLIAQEVQKIVPEAVTKDTATGYYAVDYPKLIPILIKAVQEQQADNDRQEREIDELRQKLGNLRCH
jgi:hypothetical protein